MLSFLSPSKFKSLVIGSRHELILTVFTINEIHCTFLFTGKTAQRNPTPTCGCNDWLLFGAKMCYFRVHA